MWKEPKVRKGCAMWTWSVRAQRPGPQWEGSSVLQQGEGTDAQPVAGTLLPATHRPTSLPWAEKLLIDQEEGGGGRPEGVEGAKRKSTLSEWVGIWGGRNPVGRAASPPRKPASCERPVGTLGSK